MVVNGLAPVLLSFPYPISLLSYLILYPLSFTRYPLPAILSAYGQAALVAVSVPDCGRDRVSGLGPRTTTSLETSPPSPAGTPPTPVVSTKTYDDSGVGKLEDFLVGNAVPIVSNDPSEQDMGAR